MSGGDTDPAEDEILVRAVGLTKIYPARADLPEFRAVDGIDLELRRGEAFGFLGPNGAGKSTTMRMIAATSPRSAGTLRVLGLDPDTHGSAIRARLGVVPQDDALDRELTVRENLYVYGRYFRLKRATIRVRSDELLDFAQLREKADSPVEALSGGMRRRLTIARSLINNPDMVLLDEPTTGLDPQARHVLWDRLYRLKQDGVTLLLTTHYMDEAEQLCDRLMVIDHGTIVAQGSPQELIRTHVTREVLELRFPLEIAEAAGAKLRDSPLGGDGSDIGARVEQLPDRVLVYAADGEAALADVHGMGLVPLTALVRRGTLEDVFLKLTGRSLID
ncbi:MAG TPA: ABC transporter ATP-binding protein [Actinocrinis sp.]|jgi:lipooligosaccharide transport system ATP-binding protein|uniref:ABC transporter ATP-binding protein n=1 Tax=Actinocrinis sp. TaxID=1920516 RepID=UPI002DDD322C|nr:ABC transporter ATP-binding protein [Actinocrinis sp.]HEV3171898.1 ABC transporter ATP-binding protein [Actinocrinis sp.]